MTQQYDANGFPIPDVPGYGQQNQNFGREVNYSAPRPQSAVADLEALAAANNAAVSADRTPSSGKYVYNSATGEYIWVPATAATPAPVAGLSALQAQERRGGRDSEPAGPEYERPSTQSFAEGLASAGIDYGNALGGFLPGGWLTNLLGQKYIDSRISKAAEEGGETGTYTGYAAFGDRPNNTMTEAQTQAAIAGTGGGPLSGAAFGGGFAEGNQGNSGGNFNGGFSPAAETGGGIAANPMGSDPSQRGGRDTGGDGGYGGGGDGAAGRGDVGGDRGGWGRGGGYAKGGQLKGIGDLGGYSDGGRLLRGPGDGVSDSIPANIGGKRPARLADGEFVVPARIVSELGNGSTEAGARKLYAMLDRIQAGRKKSIGKGKVATNSRADKNLPA